jgi:hypothetical protein
MYSNWRGFCGIFTLAASLAILGCGSTTNSNVRAVNASPGFPAFTFQVAQIGVASALPYGTEGVQPKGDNYGVNDSSGNYRIIGAGTNQTVITYVTPGSTPLATLKQTFVKNTDYTIVSLGTAPSMALGILTDNGTAPTSGQYGLRFMNTANSSGAVDVYITAVGASPSGSPAIPNVPFNNAIGYNPFAPGTLELQITAHGATHVLATALFSPAAGSNYSVFFFDPNPASTSGSSFSLLIVNDPIPTGKTL